MSEQVSQVRAALQVLRPHQWSKNALLFLPLLLAPGAPSVDLLLRALLAFAVFSLCASAGYVFNDMLDLEADRLNPAKTGRPFAAGALPVRVGPFLVVVLLLLAFVPSLLWLGPAFTTALTAYLFGTLLYSVYLKRLLLVDVLVLAGFYTHRILVGGVAVEVRISPWLLAFSMFFFLSLAFVKRYVELRGAEQGGVEIKNRSYVAEDAPMVAGLGLAAAYIAVLVFSLYVESKAVERTFTGTPDLLWLICPVLLYWVSRLWLLARRGHVPGDPVKFALRDGNSWLCLCVLGLVAAMARFLVFDLSFLLK